MNARASRQFIPVNERARQSDLVGIRGLLDMEELPSADISEDALDDFLGVP